MLAMIQPGAYFDSTEVNLMDGIRGTDSGRTALLTRILEVCNTTHYQLRHLGVNYRSDTGRLDTSERD